MAALRAELCRPLPGTAKKGTARNAPEETVCRRWDGGKRHSGSFEYPTRTGRKEEVWGNTTRQGMKFGLYPFITARRSRFRAPHVCFPRGGSPAATDMPQLLALCGSKNAPAVKEALLHSDEGALRNEEMTLLHVLLERDADPGRPARSAEPQPSPAHMVRLTDAQGRTPLHTPQPVPTPPPCSCYTAWARGTRRRTEKAGSRWTSFRNWAPTRWPRACLSGKTGGNRKAGWS